MQITIIGSGNVATVMGKIFQQNGYPIREVYSRQKANAKQLADLLGAEAVNDLSHLDPNADLYLLAITDNALASVAAQLWLNDKLVIHTAGSVSKEVLKNISSRYGVLWPMKMIRKQMDTLATVNMVVDGNTEAVTNQITELAEIFHGKTCRADDTVRMKMHMMATITSNFSNHLYHLAADYCSEEGIDFSLFHSIIEETAMGIRQHHPKKLQAGPAFRGDKETVNKYLELLESAPQIKEIYQVMSKSIENTNYF